jgi:hypothetical protein
VRNDTKILRSISLERPPGKTHYGLGEAPDLSGIKITGLYYDSETDTTSNETIGVTPWKRATTEQSGESKP